MTDVEWIKGGEKGSEWIDPSRTRTSSIQGILAN